MNAIERVVRRIDAFQQRHRPLAFGFGVVKKFGDDRGGQLAALLAYYGFLALFPLLLLLVTILGYVVGSNASASDAVLHSVLAEFPIIGDQLTQSVHPLHGSMAGVLVGGLGLVWGSLGAAQVLQHSMAEVWNVPGVSRPNFVTRLLRSALLLTVLGVSVVASTLLAALATFGGLSARSQVVAIASSVLVNAGVFVLGFRIATPRQIATRHLVPGALAGAVAWSVLQAAGGYLVGHQLRHAGELYGFFGSVLGLISWLYLGAQVAVYAAEINVVRARRLWPRSIVQPPLTDADREVLDAIAGEGRRRPEQVLRTGWRKPERTA
jgi:YihY family inner membrane protein